MTEDTIYNEQIEEEQEYTIDMLESAMEKSTYVSVDGLSGLLPFDGKNISKGKLVMVAAVLLTLVSLYCALRAAFMGETPFYAVAALIGVGAAALCFKDKQESHYKRIGYNFGVAAFTAAVSMAVFGL